MKKITALLTAIAIGLSTLSCAAVKASASSGAELNGSSVTVKMQDETVYDYDSDCSDTYQRSSQSRLKYWGHTNFTTGDSMAEKSLVVKNSGAIISASENRPWYFFNFSDYAIIGMGKNGETFYNSGYGKMIVYIENGRYLKAGFKSFDGSVKCSGMTIKSDNSAYLQPEYSYNKSYQVITADLYDSSFTNGIYEICASCKSGTTTKDLKLYLFVNCASDNSKDYEFYICCGEQHYAYENYNPTKRKNNLTTLLKNEKITPDTARTASRIYPFNANSYNCDTPFWEKKSHEIADGYKNLTDSEKALLFHDWITANLKYDWYKVNVLKYPRFVVPGTDEPDTTQYVSKNYTGVCLDFSCIFAVMCRENNIPCVVLSNSRHAWNAVYLNCEWVEVDLTQDVNRGVYGEDTNVVTEASIYCYTGYSNNAVNSDTPDSAKAFCY